MALVCVSGGFDPLHVGHLSMFRKAAKLGPLCVIVNSDDWLIRKKGKAFLPWWHRAELIGALRCVERVENVDDSDGTVCEALERIRPVAFVNSGDRKDCPESRLCERLGINLVYVESDYPDLHSSALLRCA